MHEFRDLGHVTAVRRLMKHNVDAVERSSDRVAIPHVALDKFRLGIYPWRLSAAVRLRLEIIHCPHRPAFRYEKIDNMRADQTRATGDECALRHTSMRLLMHSRQGNRSGRPTVSFWRPRTRETSACSEQPRCSMPHSFFNSSSCNRLRPA